MDITGKVFCFFEQSGTFRDEFIKLGFPAHDYDINNDYGCTDFILDLFIEIEKSYTGNISLFDSITQDDLIIAFFPCTYFSAQNNLIFTGSNYHFKDKSELEIANIIIQRNRHRSKHYELLLKLCTIAKHKGIRLIIENPYSVEHFLYNNFPYKPSIIDYDRRNRGDYFKKPTQYIYINCKPTNGQSRYHNPKQLTIHNFAGGRNTKSKLQRSEISREYASNFICDYIIGRESKFTIPTLF